MRTILTTLVIAAAWPVAARAQTTVLPQEPELRVTPIVAEAELTGPGRYPLAKLPSALLAEDVAARLGDGVTDPASLELVREEAGTVWLTSRAQRDEKLVFTATELRRARGAYVLSDERAGWTCTLSACAGAVAYDRTTATCGCADTGEVGELSLTVSSL